MKTAKPEAFKAVSDKFGQELKERLLRNLGEAPAGLKRVLGALDPSQLAHGDSDAVIRHAMTRRE